MNIPMNEIWKIVCKIVVFRNVAKVVDIDSTKMILVPIDSPGPQPCLGLKIITVR